MNTVLQVLSILVTLLFLAFIIRMVRSGRLRAKYSFLWLIVGTTILVFGAVPSLLNATAETVGIVYPPAMLFLGAIMLLLFIAVHFSWELSRLEERTRTLAEEIALLMSRVDELERDDDATAVQPRRARPPVTH